MLCLIAAILTPQAAIKEVVPPENSRIVGINAVGPSGELAAALEKDGECCLVVFRGQSIEQINTPKNEEFGFEEISSVEWSVNGFTDKGELFGSANTTSPTHLSMAFVSQGAAFKPVNIPEPYHSWPYSRALFVHPDGTVLVEVMTENHDAPDLTGYFIHRLILTRNGSLVRDFGFVEKPVFNSKGDLAAAEIRTNDSFETSTSSTVLWRNGDIKRIPDSSPVAFLKDGNVVISRRIKSNDEDRFELDICTVRDELVGDYLFTGKPSTLNEFHMNGDQTGFVRGFESGRAVLRLFDRSRFVELPTQGAEKARFLCERDGVFVFSLPGPESTYKFFTCQMP